MYRVFLADDNELTRKALCTSVPWNKHGLELAGQAGSGLEALEMIHEMHPDIALLDIRMPGMSGLEIAEQLSRENSPCLCIIISAYDKFEYAKQSVKLGVFDYLLKPVNNLELLRVLDKAKHTLDSRQEKDAQWAHILEQNSGYRKIMAEHKAELLEKTFAEAVNGYADASVELQNILRKEQNCYAYELLLLTPADSSSLSFDETKMSEFITFEKNNIVSFQENDSYLLMDVPRREGLLLLISFCSLQMAKDYDRMTQHIAAELLEKNELCGHAVMAAISGISQTFTELPQMLNSCLIAANSRFFHEKKRIVHFKEISPENAGNELAITQKILKLRQQLKDDPDKLPEELEEVYQLMQQNSSMNMHYAQDILIQIALMITCSFQEKTQRLSSGKDLNSIRTELAATRNLSNACQWLTHYAQEMLEVYHKYSAQHYSKLAIQILDFLNCHYGEKVALSDVALQVGISESHICRILKSETGETFVAILNKIRINRAMQMLKENKLKVYEIADAVGIPNYAYFYQIFKKETGCTPSDYQASV